MKVFVILKTTTRLSNYLKCAFALSFFLQFISVGIAQSNAIFGYNIPGSTYPLSLNHLVEGDNNHFYSIGFNLATESFLIKSDENGNIAWQKKLALGGTQTYLVPAELRFHNNHIYVLMTSDTYVSDSLGSYNDYNYELVKIDINGNLLWAKTLNLIDGSLYHKPNIDFGPAGEIVVASSSASRIELFSINDDGSTNWVKNCNSDSTEGKNPNFDIAVCDNGDIMGCSKAGNDMCFYRLSSTGIPIWSKTILGETYTHIKSIRQISTNLFIACGSSSNGFYTLMDGSGNFIYFNRVNELMEIKNIYPLDNGNFLLYGVTTYFELALIEINSAGTIINSYSAAPTDFYPVSYEGVIDMNGHLYIGDGSYIQKLDNIVPTGCFNYESVEFNITGDDPGSNPSENNFILHPTTGTVLDNPEAHLDPSAVELTYGCQQTSDIENPLAINVKVYPTLLSNSEIMFVEHEMTNEVQYSITDLNGKLVEKNVLSNSSIPVNGVSTGMYILQLTNNGNVVYHSKFVVK